MILAAVNKYLQFVDGVVAVKADMASEIDVLELESYLVSHGVVLLYAAMEQSLKKALEIKCGRCADPEVRAFALSVKDKETGRIGSGPLKGTLLRFSVACRDSFAADIEAASVKESWDSILAHRRTVAHHGGAAALTLRELRGYYSDICKFLGCVCKALALDPAEAETISKAIVLPSATPPTAD